MTKQLFCLLDLNQKIKVPTRQKHPKIIFLKMNLFFCKNRTILTFKLIYLNIFEFPL